MHFHYKGSLVINLDALFLVELQGKFLHDKWNQVYVSFLWYSICKIYMKSLYTLSLVFFHAKVHVGSFLIFSDAIYNIASRVHRFSPKVIRQVVGI